MLILLYYLKNGYLKRFKTSWNSAYELIHTIPIQKLQPMM